MDAALKPYYQKARDVYELKELERLGLTPELGQRDQILMFMALLLKWNKAAGLVSPKDEDNLFIRHFCDSLQPLLLFGFKKHASVLDFGAGGGFPAIPIRIFRPDLTFVLVESNRKKCSFLRELIEQLNFDNVSVFCGRLEKMNQEGAFDYVQSRGVGSLAKFSQLAKPLCKPEGRMYTFKTKQLMQELEEITANKDIYGVRISEIAEYDLANQILGLNLVSLAHN
jgi:16S rRNA (guanine527-N7)-methyltransferase